MSALYELAVKLSLDTTGIATGANIVMRLFAQLQGQAGLTGAQVDKLGRSLKLFAGGAALTGVGVVIASFMDKAIGKAMT